MPYYELAPLKIVRAGQDTFTYYSKSRLSIGQLLNVPLGKSSLTGMVISATKKPLYDTKEVGTILPIPTLPVQLVRTAVWMAQYYSTPLATVLQTVLPSGLSKKRRVRPTSTDRVERERTNFVFNQEQAAAIDKLDSMSPGSAILHGITGSGKTAVYVELTRRALSRGESVIILVPEIALTSQLVADFQQHFPKIVLTHSRQTEAERHNAWLSAANNPGPQVVIGPRSALFIPVNRLGLIVIDESHEPSYKQDQSPRYSALRVASVLANEYLARVIQGSATPLIAEYFLAKSAKRPIVVMDKKARLDATDPRINLIDMTKKQHFSEHRLFSDQLLKALRDTIGDGNQALIFHNRRGSASTTLCEHCGWQAICPRCFAPYTLHADKFSLHCHICGGNAKVPTSCPDCRSTEILHKGVGTKLIEAELKKLFPAANIARFDGDNTNKDTVESRYSDLYSGAINIIIGTQVIAKGLDLPRLRTVGVVQADAGLSLPDYVAKERTFQLLAQVVGRVGRSHHASNIVIQSYRPQAPPVQLGVTQNYSDFYITTISERKRANYPPFCYLLKLTCAYKTESVAIKNAKKLSLELKQKHPDLQILGPTPAFYERQANTYRWQLVIKSPVRAKLTDLLRSLPATHWQYDIDPTSLL